jgi:hypothetical protein
MQRSFQEKLRHEIHPEKHFVFSGVQKQLTSKADIKVT